MSATEAFVLFGLIIPIGILAGILTVGVRAGRRAQKASARSDVKPEQYHLSFRTGGRLLSGSFTISDGMVHVECEYGTRSAQIGGSPFETIARLVIRELADEARRRPPARASLKHKR